MELVKNGRSWARHETLISSTRIVLGGVRQKNVLNMGYTPKWHFVKGKWWWWWWWSAWFGVPYFQISSKCRWFKQQTCDIQQHQSVFTHSYGTFNEVLGLGSSRSVVQYDLSTSSTRVCGGFHKWWYPAMDGLYIYIMENTVKMDDLGVALFQETSIYPSGQMFMRVSR